MDVASLVKQYPRSKTEEKEEFVSYRYGTAGFRTKAAVLQSVVLRCGFLAATRSLTCGALAVGAVITASHNAVQDNGVKLVDPSGGMMDQSWEAIATELANSSEEDIPSVLEKLRGAHVLPDMRNRTPIVYVGRDTRPSSKELSNILIRGAKALGAEVHDFGEVTTPQLHYMVWLKNVKGVEKPNMSDYHTNMSLAFKNCLKSAYEVTNTEPHPLEEIWVDCANGVGFTGLSDLSVQVSDVVSLKLFNKVGDADVNESCGAEHVQKTRTFPTGVNASDVHKKFTSVDGDADRLVYFFVDDEGNVRLIDGDKIISLFTRFLQQLLQAAGLMDEFSLGIVQTAYANGASTKYIQETLSVPVACVKTGVKHLHHKALEYDIGVYFEANGHGTIIFNERTLKLIEEKKETSKAAECLYWLTQLINQAVGDAISDLLLAEVILASSGISVKDWDGLYKDLPSRMLKVAVPDRTVVCPTVDERRVTAPPGLQEEIDKLCEAVEHGRSFVRPSGTEDVVRVYAEATNQDIADKLANDVKNVVSRILS